MEIFWKWPLTINHVLIAKKACDAIFPLHSFNQVTIISFQPPKLLYFLPSFFAILFLLNGGEKKELVHSRRFFLFLKIIIIIKYWGIISYPLKHLGDTWHIPLVAMWHNNIMKFCTFVALSHGFAIVAFVIFWVVDSHSLSWVT